MVGENLDMRPNDWNDYSIEELTPKNKQYNIVDGPFGSNLKTIHYRKSGIPIITSGYVTDGKFFAKDYLYVDLVKFKQERRSAVRGGDIVMAKIGERCGASAIMPENNEEGILSGNALKITIDENRFSKELIAQILWQHHTVGNFETLRTTGAQPAISMANLKKYRIPLPPTKAEQTAIANALNDADALITALEKLIAKKKVIKQGAMQELLRPKAGWKVEKLGDLTKVFTKQTGFDYTAYIKPSLVKTKTDETIPFIQNKDFNNKWINFNTDHYIPKSVAINFPRILLNEKSLLISISGSVGNVGIYESKELAFIGGAVAILKFKNPSLIDWVWIYLKSERGQEKLFGSTKSSSHVNLILDDIRKLEIEFPNEIEQARLAQIFTDMDSEIEALEQKLEKQKRIKQGMMQVLLTGKIRLV